MKLNNKKLIIIDGMPGSGKTTCATMLSDQLSAWNVTNRCILELEDNHPLFIQGKFSSFEDEAQADLFIEGLQALFRALFRKGWPVRRISRLLKVYCFRMPLTARIIWA